MRETLSLGTEFFLVVSKHTCLLYAVRRCLCDVGGSVACSCSGDTASLLSKAVSKPVPHSGGRNSASQGRSLYKRPWNDVFRVEAVGTSA